MQHHADWYIQLMLEFWMSLLPSSSGPKESINIYQLTKHHIPENLNLHL